MQHTQALEPKALSVTSLSVPLSGILSTQQRFVDVAKEKGVDPALQRFHTNPPLGSTSIYPASAEGLVPSSCCFSRDRNKAQVKGTDRARKLKEPPQTPAAVLFPTRD